MGADFALPATGQYERLLHTIERLLHDEERLAATRRSAGDYFDRFCTHEQLDAYILECVGSMAREDASLVSERSAATRGVGA